MNVPRPLHVSLKSMAEGKGDAKVAGVAKATYFKLAPNKIEFEEGFNVRDEGPALDAYLEKMYIAMKAGAAFPAIDVSVIDGRIIASDGHCRTRTAKRLVAEGFPYLLEARQFRGNEVERTFHMLGTGQGKPLNPLEAGRGYARLVRYGLSVSAIAERMGVTPPTIYNGLTLAEAPVALQRMIIDEAISAQVALEAITKHGSKAADVLAVAIEAARQGGVKKVTKKHLGGPRMTPKQVRALTEATTTLRGVLNVELLMSQEDDAMVQVPARELKALFGATEKPAKEKEAK